MKHFTFLVLLLGMSVSTLTAQKPLDPSCNIIGKNIKTNRVLARDNTTGRLYQFKADALDINAVKPGDPITITQNKITAINGATRTYATVKPDYVEPCCSIVSIRPDPDEPCCAIVTFKNAATGALSQFKAPKNISSTLRVGHTVYAQPTGAINMQPDGIEPVNEFAIVQSSYGSSNGQMASYGYPATSGDESSNTENAAEKWVITPVPTMKGVLGRLNMNFPAGLDWNVGNLAITQQADNKYITSFSGDALKTTKSYNIGPGEYLIHLNNIPVENVPIQKGHETRIKTGVLKILSEGRWELYNESKEKQLTSYPRPLMFVLPVGTYQLNIGGQFFPVTIKDGETVDETGSRVSQGKNNQGNKNLPLGSCLTNQGKAHRITGASSHSKQYSFINAEISTPMPPVRV